MDILMADISIGIPTVKEVSRCDIEHISGRRIRFLSPGEMIIAEMNGAPIIISTTQRSSEFQIVMVAHTADVQIVDDIIWEFRRQGVPTREVTMHIQTGDREKGAQFVTQAIIAGAKHVWHSSQIDDYLKKVEFSRNRKLITIRRQLAKL